MEGLGQLAFRKGGSALAYRKCGHALVYKGEPRPITIRIPWGPQSYTCATYSAYHELGMSVSSGWLVGSGTILEQVTEGAEFIFKIKAIEAPAQFFVRLAGASPCVAAADGTEIPDMWASAVATQQGAGIVEIGQMSGMCMTSREVVFDINEAGTVSGIWAVA